MSDDDQMIEDVAADFCARDPEYKRVRALRGATPSFEPSTWAALAEMGWVGSRVAESLGGTALSFHQLTLILEHHGRSLAPEPLTPVGVLAAGILSRTDNAAGADWLQRLAAGLWLPALAWQEQGGDPHSMMPVETRAKVRGDGYVLHGRKCCVPIGEAANAFIVSARSADGCGLYVVGRDSPGLTVTVHRRVDGGTWSDLTLQAVSVDASARIAAGSAAADVLERALDEARLAVGAELVGVMAAVFDMSVEYLKVRRQFDKPIGSFQALQHRAVDMYAQVELSRAVLRQSAAAFDASQDGQQRAIAASQLKARASHAALMVAKHAVQVHGGIGYTEECNVSLFLKRAMVLAAWLGNAPSHRARYGRLTELRRDAPDAESREPRTALQEEARAFIEANFPPEWRFPPYRMNLAKARSWLRKLHERGWGAPSWPVEFGGLGLSAYEQVKLQEEFDRHGIFLTPNSSVSMLGPLLIRYGTEAQRKKYFPGILSGETLWAQGYSEPGAGSDLASLRATAVLDGDDFIVNGQKTWTSLAADVEMIFMLVRTDPAAKKQDGISFLLADLKSPGITVRPIINLSGESGFCEVFFDNVRVPRENLVGEINRGWKMAKSLLGSERVMVGHPKLARYPLQLLERLLRTRGLWDDPVTRARFEELRLDVADLSAAFVRIVDVLRRGGEPGAEVSILKIWITETMQRVTDLMLESAGDDGVIDEAQTLADGTTLHVAKQYFLSRAASIYGGTNEIQRNIVAKAVLGLPS